MNGLLFASGQIALVPETGELAGDTIEAQSRQVMKNVGALLEAAGTDFDHVVKTTCFLDDINDFAAFNAIYAESFGERCPPVRASQLTSCLRAPLLRSRSSPRSWGSSWQRKKLRCSKSTMPRCVARKRSFCMSTTLSLRKAENIALLGPNGAGKSTFIQLLTREVLPLHRDVPPVIFRGQERPSLADIKACFGVVSNTMHDQVRVHLPARDIVCGGLFGTLGIPRHVHATGGRFKKARRAA